MIRFHLKHDSSLRFEPNAAGSRRQGEGVPERYGEPAATKVPVAFGRSPLGCGDFAQSLRWGFGAIATAIVSSPRLALAQNCSQRGRKHV